MSNERQIVRESGQAFRRTWMGVSFGISGAAIVAVFITWGVTAPQVTSWIPLFAVFFLIALGGLGATEALVRYYQSICPHARVYTRTEITEYRGTDATGKTTKWSSCMDCHKRLAS